ncbi:sugar-binding protein [Paenibacillus sp. 453mf]|uniref:sugar-binding protein n=1 Tax=Paenibacillus sp. 453mf TaxID=1761874 RepID=UPI0008F17A2A|nr:sugar-binding protein [Paenibacillus sp. 453mf]SFS81581.1 monosaccharide ABC transporter substrate-binding protein, CUT2 family [Paenibacillus sp. 453mf]
MLKSWLRPHYILIALLLLLTVSISLTHFMKALHYESGMSSITHSHNPEIHLVLISQELDNPYWRLIEHGARSAAEKNHATLEYIGPVEASVSEQIRLIEMAVAAKIDGILTQGLDEEQFVSIVDQAIELGIPVITIDSDAPDSRRLAYVGTDNYAAGFMAGKALIQDTGGNANVGIVTGSFHAANLKERVRGFLDAVKREDGIRILDMKESNIDRIGSASAAYTMSREHEALDTFVGTSALDAMGIAQMLNDRSQDSHASEHKDIRVFGFDDLPETIELIDKGIVSASIVQKPYQMGAEGVELMLDYLGGKRIVSVYNTDARIIRKEDLSMYKGGNGGI